MWVRWVIRVARWLGLGKDFIKLIRKMRKNKDKSSEGGFLNSRLGKRVLHGTVTVVCLVGISVLVNKGCVSEETGDVLKDTVKEVVKEMQQDTLR